MLAMVAVTVCHSGLASAAGSMSFCLLSATSIARSSRLGPEPALHAEPHLGPTPLHACQGRRPYLMAEGSSAPAGEISAMRPSKSHQLRSRTASSMSGLMVTTLFDSDDTDTPGRRGAH